MEQDWYKHLLGAITSAQSKLVGSVRPQPLFDGLLSSLLDLAQSEYGFIGEIHRNADGSPYLKTHAITNIAWNRETQRFFEENIANGLEFHNLETLFGAVMTEQKPVIANSPATDPRRGGLPKGHPPLNAFLGLPLRSGGEMVGMLAVANHPDGYNQDLVDRLEPFLQTCANAIFALRADRARKQAEASLNGERERLRAILDGAFEAIITVDDAGMIETFNARAEAMFGYSARDVCGRHLEMLVPKSQALYYQKALDRRRDPDVEAIAKYTQQVGARRRDGVSIPIEITITEINVGNKRLYTGMMRDLSDLQHAQKRLQTLETELERSRHGHMVGASRAMRRLYSDIEKISPGDWTVLIEGETGSGKELVARAIHAASDRRHGPFVAVNCAGLTDTLLGSQLFGHRRGSFSGALRDQKGFFEAAEGGTLFLDEIGDVSQEVQKSLLRVLQDKQIIAVGDTEPKKVDVRVIAATHQDLDAMVSDGRFRQDLFYRLRVARVPVPPLRKRLDDVGLLVEAFLAEMRIASGKTIGGVSNDALRRLEAHDWPGNVRELRSAIQHATIHCHGETIHCRHLPPELLENCPVVKQREGDHLDAISRALEETGGNRRKAAELLGISRATLYRRLNELNIPAKADTSAAQDKSQA
ncbi:MAG: sigma 54-interacting transcriptional regulator [Xanthomonadales bacterium]|nr:sigma 54-interacting transcriptional regulator [Xanthomonadales bacterium]